ncbi:MAG: glycosyltransferase family 2 protein [Chitinophagaceae bacterium]
MSPSPPPSLSIVIVNYQSSDLIINNLKSVFDFNRQILLEVIVVDNLSGDDSEQKIGTQFPEVRWLQMGYNSGFARANNAGIKAAGASSILLLNPDTISLDDSITKCFIQLADLDFVGAGLQLVDSNRRPQISGSRFVPWGLNHLLPLPYWGPFIRWIGYKSGSKDPNILHAKEVEEVDWISGAFLMVKKDAINKTGMLDEDFFLYAEEVEWCSRLRKVGKLCLFGNLKMIHLEGATINESVNNLEKGYYNLYDKKGLQLMVSNHLRIRKQYGVLPFLFLLFNYIWGVGLFFVAGFIENAIAFKNPFSYFPKGWAFAKNVMSLWMLVPRIIANKPFFYKMM